MSERTHVNGLPDQIILRERAQGPRGRGDDMKPEGFWYEVDGDWRRWMVAEQWGLKTANHLHAVDLADCRMLTIATLDELDTFNEMYGVDNGHERFYGVRWADLAQEYDGIEIAPYQWKRRLANGMAWYYTWDVASGCIWRPRGATVTHIRAIDPSELRELSEATQ